MAALLSPGHDDVGDRAAADDLKRPEIIAITTDVAFRFRPPLSLKRILQPKLNLAHGDASRQRIDYAKALVRSVRRCASNSRAS
jgi:hypothetical protein